MFDKEAKLVDKVVQGIEDDAQDEREELEMDPDNFEAKEMLEMYEEDAADYRAIADLLRCGQAEDACEKWDNLDTASRDYLVDHLSDEEVEEVTKAFGYDEDTEDAHFQDWGSIGEPS